MAPGHLAGHLRWHLGRSAEARTRTHFIATLLRDHICRLRLRLRFSLHARTLRLTSYVIKYYPTFTGFSVVIR